MPCCKLNVFFNNFYHKNSCKGILYIGELNGSLIVVCEKCHAINFYDRFIWTCPLCGKRFRDKMKINSKNDFINNVDNNKKENENINSNETNNEQKVFYKNIISNRKIYKANKDNIINQNKISNNNDNLNKNFISKSPKRKKFRDIKESSNNNSGFFNLDNMKNMIKLEENSQIMENNKI